MSTFCMSPVTGKQKEKGIDKREFVCYTIQALKEYD